MTLKSFFRAFAGIFIARYRVKNPKAGEMLDTIQMVLDAENNRGLVRSVLLAKIDSAGKRNGLTVEERALLKTLAEDELDKRGIR